MSTMFLNDFASIHLLFFIINAKYVFCSTRAYYQPANGWIVHRHPLQRRAASARVRGVAASSPPECELTNNGEFERRTVAAGEMAARRPNDGRMQYLKKKAG